jgi:hypothetical protein
MRKALLLPLVPAVLAGAWAWNKKHNSPCCDGPESPDFGQLWICEHSKVWRLGYPQFWEIGPLEFTRVPGWQRISQTQAMKLLRSDMNADLVNLMEARDED